MWEQCCEEEIDSASADLLPLTYQEFLDILNVLDRTERPMR
jgi:hypothetical protein